MVGKICVKAAEDSQANPKLRLERGPRLTQAQGLRRTIDNVLCLDKCRDVGLISWEASWDKGKKEGEVRPQASEA